MFYQCVEKIVNCPIEENRIYKLLCKQYHKYLCVVLVCSTIIILLFIRSHANEHLVSSLKFQKMIYPPDCFCGDENFCLPIMGSIYPVLQQKFFNCSLKTYLDKFRLFRKYKTLEVKGVELSENVNFVTAASSNHFNLSRGFVKNLREVHPNSKVIYYDLGLDEEQIIEVKTWCNVEYQKFEFKHYPAHVKNLMNYAWKVLLIAEQFTKNQTFIYADSSIRFNKFYSPQKIFKAVKDSKIEPYTALKSTYHSIFATTSPLFYKYIPLPKIISQNYREDAASIQLVLPVDYTRSVLKWKVLCALTENCIAPKDHHLNCVFEGKDRYKIYRNCHRYDQSLFCSITAHMLFGSKGYAYKMGYTKKTIIDTEADVKRVLRQRKINYFAINQMIDMHRDDLINSTLNLNCPLTNPLNSITSSIQNNNFVEGSGQDINLSNENITKSFRNI